MVIMNLIHSFAGVGKAKSIVTASPLKRVAGSLICLTIVPTRVFAVQIHIPGNISCYESFFKAFFNPSKVTRKHGGGGWGWGRWGGQSDPSPLLSTPFIRLT